MSSTLSGTATQALETRLSMSIQHLRQLGRRVLVEPSSDPALRQVQMEITRLLDHPRRKLVRKVGSEPFVHYEWCDAGGHWRALSGLRPALHRIFYPHLGDEEQLAWVKPGGHKRSYGGGGGSDESATEKRQRQAEAKPQPNEATMPRHQAPLPRARTNARYCMSYGTEHGALVHLQIQRFIESMTHGYRSPLEAREVIDPCTVALLETFKQERWAPIASEYTIYDEETRIGTQADVIVYDMAESCLRVIELTFGYESVDFTHALKDSDRFEPPLAMVRNSPAQRKLLQLTMTAEILRRHYGVRTIRRALVRVCPRSHVVWVYSNVAWWSDVKAIKEAYALLITSAAAASVKS